MGLKAVNHYPQAKSFFQILTHHTTPNFSIHNSIQTSNMHNPLLLFNYSWKSIQISRTKVQSPGNKLPRIKSMTIGQKSLKLIFSKATNRRDTAPLLSDNSPPILGFLKIHGHLYSSHSTTIGYWLYWLHYLSLSWTMTHTTTILVALIHGYVY